MKLISPELRNPLGAALYHAFWADYGHWLAVQAHPRCSGKDVSRGHYCGTIHLTDQAAGQLATGLRDQDNQTGPTARITVGETVWEGQLWVWEDYCSPKPGEHEFMAYVIGNDEDGCPLTIEIGQDEEKKILIDCLEAKWFQRHVSTIRYNPAGGYAE